MRRISGSAIDDYGYDLAGKRASRWDGTTAAASLIQAYVNWNGEQIASYGAGQVIYRHADLLGTFRLSTLYNGISTVADKSLPFGEADGTVPPIQFAGLWADTASNTDLAIFREYSPASGRWMSPDPYDGSYDASNPQSLNRYSYVLSNPMSLSDPSGQDYIDKGGNPCYVTTTVDTKGNIRTTDSCDTYGPLSPGLDGNLPWFIIEYGGGYGPQYGQCLSSNGSSYTCGSNLYVAPSGPVVNAPSKPAQPQVFRTQHQLHTKENCRNGAVLLGVGAVATVGAGVVIALAAPEVAGAAALDESLG